MSDTAQLPVEEPPPATVHDPAMLSWHRHISVDPYSGSARERAAYLAGYRANPIHEEAL